MNEGDRQQHAGEQRTNGEVERWGREGRRHKREGDGGRRRGRRREGGGGREASRASCIQQDNIARGLWVEG